MRTNISKRFSKINLNFVVNKDLVKEPNLLLKTVNYFLKYMHISKFRKY